jgi:hypothetical protein
MPADENEENQGPRFAFTRLNPEQTVGPGTDHFSVFLVRVKSDTEEGRAMLHDPIRFLEENAPDMGLRKGETRAMVLRVNAEVQSNPKHRIEVWAIYPGSTNAICIQYKEDPDDPGFGS